MNIKSLHGTFRHHNAKAARCWDRWQRTKSIRRRHYHFKRWKHWGETLMSISDKIITGRIK